MSLKSTLTDILDVVAFSKDENGDENSILAKAKIDLEVFLTEHTSISDDEKAKRIYDFFTNTITNVTVQAIAVAGQTPLQDAQIQTMKDETAQKIDSMKIDDTNKTNDITQRIISMQKDDDLKEQQIASMIIDDGNKTKESSQKILSMINDDKVNMNNSAVNVAKAKAEIETLMPVQIQEITKNIELKTKEIESEDKKIDIMDEDILIKKAQVGLEEAKIPLYQAQADNERAKVGLTAQQVRVSATDVQYKLAQLKAIQKAGDLNKEIEDNKNTTNIKIAKIYKA